MQVGKGDVLGEVSGGHVWGAGGGRGVLLGRQAGRQR